MLFNLTACFRYSDSGFEDSVNASVNQRLLEVEGGDEVIEGLSESVKVVLDLKRTRQGEFGINLEHLIVELSELGASTAGEASVLSVASTAGVAITCTGRSLLRVTMVLKGANLILLIMLVY
jgi:hypothetical protein